MSAALPEILVFCPEPEQAERYRELILARYPGAPVASASNALKAEPYIDRAEIVLCRIHEQRLGDAAGLDRSGEKRDQHDAPLNHRRPHE